MFSFDTFKESEYDLLDMICFKCYLRNNQFGYVYDLLGVASVCSCVMNFQSNNVICEHDFDNSNNKKTIFIGTPRA